MLLIKQNRLDFLLEFIIKANNLADIGTDHAYVPIKALQLKKVSSAFAVDLNAKPLLQASENVRRAGLTSQVELIQADGLVWFAHRQKALDYVIIAGLGSSTISQILTNDYERIANYLICSNTEPLLIKQALKAKGLLIKKETFLIDHERQYWFLWVSRSEGTIISSTEDLYLATDKTLFADTDYQQFLLKQKAKYTKLLPVVNPIQRTHYQLLIDLIQEAQEKWKHKK